MHSTNSLVKKFILFALFLLPTFAYSSTITSAQNGNWGNTSTWAGGVVPGNGDTVILFHVVSATDTRIVGTSPAAGNIVVTLNSTGTIHVTSTGHLQIRGDVTYTADSSTQDAVDVDGGGIFEFDSSLATSPLNQHYAFYPNNNFGFRAFVITGSSTTHGVLKANGSSGQGALRVNGFAYAGSYQFLYADLMNMRFESYFPHDTTFPIGWNVTYSSFNNCGLIENPGGLYTTSVFHHDHNYHLNTPQAGIFNFDADTFNQTGVRSIQYNVFDVALSTNSGFGDFVIAHNFMTDPFQILFATPSLFTDNFVRVSTTIAANGANINGFSGTMITSYILLDVDFTNPHVIPLFGNFSSSFDEDIFGQTGRASGLGGDDSGEFILGGSVIATTNTITRSIFLPNGQGYSSLEMTSYLSNELYVDDFEHNTWFGGFGLGSQYAAMDYSETGNTQPGGILAFKNNIVWNPELPGLTAGFTKLFDVGNQGSNQGSGYGVGTTTDVCSPSNCDYNSSYGLLVTTLTAANSAAYVNQGKGYLGRFSSTPGVHDKDGVNPSFVDYHRNIEEFDGRYYRPYLAMSAATAWASGSSYSVGNVVSHSTGTFYWGDSVNYRYTNSTGCVSTNPEPGAGLLSGWEPCWEIASFQDIRGAIVSSATFTDASIGASASTINTTLALWIRAGYAPTNMALKSAASDGSDIGAVPVYIAPGSVPSQSISGNTKFSGGVKLQ